MRKIFRNQMAIMYMLTDMDEDKMKQSPPVHTQAMLDGPYKTAVEVGLRDAAKFWDEYRKVLSVSILVAGTCNHYILCGDEPVKFDCDAGTVSAYLTEKELIQAVFTRIHEVFNVDEASDCIMDYHMLLGWRMQTSIWPMLVNKAFAYDIKVPGDLLVGVDTRWQKDEYMGDIANIYMQGARYARSLPSLPNLLRFWGYAKASECQLPLEHALEICANPEHMAGIARLFLDGIYDVCSRYVCNPVSTSDDFEQPASIAAPTTPG